ncbi:hypothetical protein NEMIN01_0715 [Nematocida minor]|uniref:uncharacterized protein n=1 Tax=Nematocida minor TaxID=1912983 RepID=UPI0022204A3D|nr:uncharacterized protein NEMIN01_0715 [Nematocida minor]KAI5189852.1 hypothetical protein NEMIN01_0715 [Nematocida minor]
MRGVVKIHNANRALTRRIVEVFFSRFGQIKKITMPNRSATYALVEYATQSEANKAIKELDGTTLRDIYGKKKLTKNASAEFIWNLSVLTEDYLWEEDEQDITKIEKQIVRQKKRNLSYIESLGDKITLATDVRQRPVIKLVSAEPKLSRKNSDDKNQADD